MRYVTNIPPATPNPFTRQVNGLSATYAVRPVRPRDQPIEKIDKQTVQQAIQPVHPQEQRDAPLEDRRKACRRLVHLPVLIELRSGVERRRHNLRQGDIVEHIDETA